MNSKILGAALAAGASLAALGLGAGSVHAASNGVSIVHDNGATCDPQFAGSPCFGPPNTGLKSGDSTTLVVTVEQSNPNPDATVTLTWDGNLTFVSNGDTTAVCTPGTKSETCTYTDYAHTDKSDSYNFTVGANAPGAVITTTIDVATGSTPAVTDGGTDTAKATLTMAAPAATLTPTASPSPAGGVKAISTPAAGVGGTPAVPVGVSLLMIGGAAVVVARRKRGAAPA